MKWMRRMMIIVASWVMTAAGGTLPATVPSENGALELTLTRADVRQGVLTVQVTIANRTDGVVDYGFFFNDVYYTDSGAKKKYFGLKDTQGNYLCGPKNDALGFSRQLDPGGRLIFWMKFPAPPETVKTIDLFLPGALPFEAVPLTRE